MSEQERRRAAILALEQTGGNVTAAAVILGVSSRTLYRHMKKWGLTGPGSCHVTDATSATRATVRQPETESHATPPNGTVVRHELDAQQRFSLTAIRERSTLHSDDMSTETLLTMGPVGRRPRFLTRDRWHVLELAAIDLSSKLRKTVTIENIMAALVDTKLQPLVAEVIQAHDEAEAEKKKGGQK